MSKQTGTAKEIEEKAVGGFAASKASNSTDTYGILLQEIPTL